MSIEISHLSGVSRDPFGQKSEKSGIQDGNFEEIR